MGQFTACNETVGKGGSMSNLKAKEYVSFEAIKHVSDDGAEFWYARELAPVLEYVQWRNFIKVLDSAILACKNSGYAITDHFAEVSKTIKMPKTATKRVIDFKLTRYACYLIVQNLARRILEALFEPLIKMLEIRVDDRSFIRLVRKWLNAGVLNPDGTVEHPQYGIPQGSIVSPVRKIRTPGSVAGYGSNLVSYADAAIKNKRAARTTNQLNKSSTHMPIRKRNV
jgi:hypothetical protein